MVRPYRRFQGSQLHPSLNYTTGAWGFHDQGISCGIEPGAFRYSTVGTPNGKLFWTESSDVIEFDGGPISAFAETKPIDLKAADAWKVLQHCKFVMRGSRIRGRLFQAWWQERLTDNVTWSDPYTIELVNHEEFLENFGFVFLTIRLYSNSNAAQWTLEGFEARGVGVGKEF